MALTKKQLLQTTKDTEEVEIEALKGKFEDPVVTIRPLSDSEYSEIEDKTMEGLNISNKLDKDMLDDIRNLDDEERKEKILENLGLDVNLAQLNKKDKEANYLACKYGLSTDDEEWTLEEIGQLPTGAPSEIANAIFEYTGVDLKSKKQLKSFRGE